jgi:uncharacterized lipoprotein YehR (DUF1307 family)
MSFVFALSIAMSITACGESDDTAKSHAQRPPPKETVFDDLIATEERAKQTEKTIQQSKDNLDAALKQTEESGSAQKPND